MTTPRLTNYVISIRTEEMRPEWFSIDKKGDSLGISDVDALPPVPFQKMWEDDPFWLPLLLDNKYFVGRADFAGCGADGTGGSMMKYCFVTRNRIC
jgi:8-oxo-dGTP diphosphatase/2-hydroxy-dATP diphosphatase